MAKKETKKGSKDYDLVIIGGGGSGLAAAMYASRLGLRNLVLGHSHGTELPIGGVITTTNVVENYPGFIRLTGTEIAQKIEEHARSYDLTEIKEEKAETITKKAGWFLVKTPDAEYNAKTILFATGTKWRKLDVPGAKEFENKGVNFCALCDGPLFRNRTLAVVGGSDSAAKDALLLTEFAKKVYIIYRGEQIRPEPINFERVMKNKKIEIINNTNVIEVKGSDFVERVVLDKPYNGKKELELDGLFIAIGHIVLSDLAKTLGVKTNEKGEIVTDKTASTNVPGIFAAGDVADTPFKQLITGVAEGCIGAHSAYEFISKGK